MSIKTRIAKMETRIACDFQAALRAMSIEDLEDHMRSLTTADWSRVLAEAVQNGTPDDVELVVNGMREYGLARGPGR